AGARSGQARLPAHPQRGRSGRCARGAAVVPDERCQPQPREPRLAGARALLLHHALRRPLHLGHHRGHHPHPLRKALRVSASTADRGAWLRDSDLQRLLSALAEGGEEARVAGGAVRNALLGEPVADIDIATTTLPDETERRARGAGYRTVPTG